MTRFGSKKLTVKTIAAYITLSPDPAIEVLNGARGIEEFVKDGNNGFRMTLGANSSVIVSSSRESHLQDSC